MKFKQLVKAFAKHGFDLEYFQGGLYTCREFGTTNVKYEERGRASIEARLDLLNESKAYTEQMMQ